MAHISVETGALPAFEKTYNPQPTKSEKRTTVASIQAWRRATLDPRFDRIRRQEAIWSQSLDGRRT